MLHTASHSICPDIWHYELRMYTHTHMYVHVTTSLAHYTHTHLGAVSHSVDDTLQQKDQGTSPSEKGTEREGWEPIEVEGELRQEERRRESMNRPHLTNTHATICTRSRMHTHTENKKYRYIWIYHTPLSYDLYSFL